MLAYIFFNIACMHAQINCMSLHEGGLNVQVTVVAWGINGALASGLGWLRRCLQEI